MENKELNHGRLAMIAMIGMIFQEYATGVPSTVAFVNWLDSEGLTGPDSTTI
jgi:Chlorophyll A-B binding protein